MDHLAKRADPGQLAEQPFDERGSASPQSAEK
jgi:hypothetical protein